jgi:putative addiction module component (TIGR02574 family)
MRKAATLEIAQLSLEEKLELLDRLWESLGRDPETLPLTMSQREELDRRLDELEDEGPTGLSWDEVVAQRFSSSRTVHAGEKMAAALENLAASRVVSGIEDPVVWQKDIRRDRRLPGRE